MFSSKRHILHLTEQFTTGLLENNLEKNTNIQIHKYTNIQIHKYSKVPEKLNMWYIIEKGIIQRFQKLYSYVSNAHMKNRVPERLNMWFIFEKAIVQGYLLNLAQLYKVQYFKGTGYRDVRNYDLSCNTCKYTKSNTEIIPLSNTPYKCKFLKSLCYKYVINDMLPTIGEYISRIYILVMDIFCQLLGNN